MDEISVVFKVLGNSQSKEIYSTDILQISFWLKDSYYIPPDNLSSAGTR